MCSHNIKTAASKPNWTLPWLHRHFPLSLKVVFDKFQKPPKPTPPKITPPRTRDDQLEFRRAFAVTFAELTGQPARFLGTSLLMGAACVYTDGACPDQYNIRVANPAGWGFTHCCNYVWTDSWGPAGQKLDLSLVGSNNTAELQALLEALDYIARHKKHHGITLLNIYTYIYIY